MIRFVSKWTCRKERNHRTSNTTNLRCDFLLPDVFLEKIVIRCETTENRRIFFSLILGIVEKKKCFVWKRKSSWRSVRWGKLPWEIRFDSSFDSFDVERTIERMDSNPNRTNIQRSHFHRDILSRCSISKWKRVDLNFDPERSTRKIATNCRACSKRNICKLHRRTSSLSRY